MRKLDYENGIVVDVSLTIDELGAVIKSLGIGCDQLVKKIRRLDPATKGRIMSELSDEYHLLLDAKQELESVYALALVGDN